MWGHLSFFPPPYPSLKPSMTSLESSFVASKIRRRPSFNFSSASSAFSDFPFFSPPMVPYYKGDPLPCQRHRGALIYHQGIICGVAFDRSSLWRIALYASVVAPRRLASNTLLVIRNAPADFSFDGFVKSPTAALRLIFRHCGVLVSTPHSSRFASLAFELFSVPSLF